MKNQPFLYRLGYAISGLVATWKGEASFRFQFLACTGVVAVLTWRQAPPIWWALLLTLCGLVLAAEMFNTALETALDHLHPERHPAIGTAKDCAAGAVLLLSIVSAAVFCIFLVESFRLA